MLDVGGFSLATMGEQAREQGDTRAAHKASVTGYFLIGVTIVTLLLVTVGLLWSPTKYYTDQAEKGLILVRVVMTVIYAHVIHSLRQATAHAITNQVDVLATTVTEQFQRLEEELARVQQDMHRQFTSELTATNRRLTDLSERIATTDRQLANLPEHLAATDRRLTDILQPLQATMQEHTSALEGLAALPGRLCELEQSLLSLSTAPSHKLHLSVVTSDRPHRSVSVPTSVGSDQPTDNTDGEATDKGAFVRRCLSDNPTMRVADIQRQAAHQGLRIAHSYISDLRKAFLAEQDKQAQQETA